MKCCYCHSREVYRWLSPYCSVECADKDAVIRHGKLFSRDTTCLNCGKILSAIKIRKFCGSDCRSEYKNKNKPIRVQRKPKHHERIPIDEKTQLEVMRASNWACVYCGNDATAIDHINPICQGGNNSRGNLVAACARCNGIASGKAFRSVTEKQQYILSRSRQK